MNPKTAELSDSELIHLLKRKSVKDFELLYDIYAPALYNVARTLISDQQIAGKALETAFCKIWSDLNQFDAEKMRLFTWMYQIIRSTALQYNQTIVDHRATTASLSTTHTGLALSIVACTC